MAIIAYTGNYSPNNMVSHTRRLDSSNLQVFWKLSPLYISTAKMSRVCRILCEISIDFLCCNSRQHWQLLTVVSVVITLVFVTLSQAETFSRKLYAISRSVEVRVKKIHCQSGLQSTRSTDLSAWCNIPEDLNLHQHHCENVISHSGWSIHLYAELHCCMHFYAFSWVNCWSL